MFREEDSIENMEQKELFVLLIIVVIIHHFQYFNYDCTQYFEKKMSSWRC